MASKEQSNMDGKQRQNQKQKSKIYLREERVKIQSGDSKMRKMRKSPPLKVSKNWESITSKLFSKHII